MSLPILSAYGSLLTSARAPLRALLGRCLKLRRRGLTECSGQQTLIRPCRISRRSAIAASFLPRTSSPVEHGCSSRRYLSSRQYSRTPCIAFSEPAAASHTASSRRLSNGSHPSGATGRLLSSTSAICLEWTRIRFGSDFEFGTKAAAKVQALEGSRALIRPITPCDLWWVSESCLPLFSGSSV